MNKLVKLGQKMPKMTEGEDFPSLQFGDIYMTRSIYLHHMIRCNILVNLTIKRAHDTIYTLQSYSIFISLLKFNLF